MYRRFLSLVLIAGLLLPASGKAVDGPKGLQIDPLRRFIELDAGAAHSDSITVTDLTDQPMDVTLGIQSFKLADFTYEYVFENPQHNWVAIDQPNVHLEPGQARKVTYTITIPADAAVGGQYFSILASTKFASGAIDTQVQAASVIYATVKGALVQTAELVDASISPLSFTDHIPYSLDVRNTGNVHFFIYNRYTVAGPLGSKNNQGTAQLLMPDTVRKITTQAVLPFWPGVYKISYGTPKPAKCVGLPPRPTPLTTFTRATLAATCWTTRRLRSA